MSISIKICGNLVHPKNGAFEQIENFFGSHYRHNYDGTYYRVGSLKASPEGNERFVALKLSFYRTYHLKMVEVECVPLAQGDYVTSCSSDDDHWDHYELPKSHGFGQQVWVTPRKSVTLEKVKGTRNSPEIVFKGEVCGKDVEVTIKF